MWHRRHKWFEKGGVLNNFGKFARGSEKQRKKTKKLSTPTKWGMERSGKGSSGFSVQNVRSYVLLQLKMRQLHYVEGQ
jgi:hypothetical protein